MAFSRVQVRALTILLLLICRLGQYFLVTASEYDFTAVDETEDESCDTPERAQESFRPFGGTDTPASSLITNESFSSPASLASTYFPDTEEEYLDVDLHFELEDLNKILTTLNSDASSFATLNRLTVIVTTQMQTREGLSKIIQYCVKAKRFNALSYSLSYSRNTFSFLKMLLTQILELPDEDDCRFWLDYVFSSNILIQPCYKTAAAISHQEQSLLTRRFIGSVHLEVIDSVISSFLIPQPCPAALHYLILREKIIQYRPEYFHEYIEMGPKNILRARYDEALVAMHPKFENKIDVETIEGREVIELMCKVSNHACATLSEALSRLIMLIVSRKVDIAIILQFNLNNIGIHLAIAELSKPQMCQFVSNLLMAFVKEQCSIRPFEILEDSNFMSRCTKILALYPWDSLSEEDHGHTLAISYMIKELFVDSSSWLENDSINYMPLIIKSLLDRGNGSPQLLAEAIFEHENDNIGIQHYWLLAHFPEVLLDASHSPSINLMVQFFSGPKMFLTPSVLLETPMEPQVFRTALFQHVSIENIIHHVIHNLSSSRTFILQRIAKFFAIETVECKPRVEDCFTRKFQIRQLSEKKFLLKIITYNQLDSGSLFESSRTHLVLG